MGGFQYMQDGLPDALVAFAQLFDALAIICSGGSCHGQHAAWTSAWPNAPVLVADGAVQDTLHNFSMRRMQHGRVNAVLHGDAIRGVRSRWPDARHVLVLEADYKWVGGSTRNTAEMAYFINDASVSWEVLRLGYNPVGGSSKAPATHDIQKVAPHNFGPLVPSSSACPSACVCQPVVRGVCAVERPLNRSSYCDVRSLVAYAVHARAFDRLLLYADEQLANNGDARRWAFNDVWVPATFSPLHYAAPGLLTDGTASKWKQDSEKRMQSFAARCAISTPEPATPTSSALPLPRPLSPSIEDGPQPSQRMGSSSHLPARSKSSTVKARRVAVCLVGYVRTFAQPNVRENVIAAIRSHTRSPLGDAWHVDVFAVLANGADTVKGQSKPLTEPLVEEARRELLDAFPAGSVTWAPVGDADDGVAIDASTCNLPCTGQFEKLDRCAQLVAQAEMQHGHGARDDDDPGASLRYAWVVKMRPDLLITPTPAALPLASYRNDTVYSARGYDQLVYIPRPLLDAVANGWRTVDCYALPRVRGNLTGCRNILGAALARASVPWVLDAALCGAPSSDVATRAVLRELHMSVMHSVTPARSPACTIARTAEAAVILRKHSLQSLHGKGADEWANYRADAAGHVRNGSAASVLVASPSGASTFSSVVVTSSGGAGTTQAQAWLNSKGVRTNMMADLDGTKHMLPGCRGFGALKNAKPFGSHPLVLFLWESPARALASLARRGFVRDQALKLSSKSCPSLLPSSWREASARCVAMAAAAHRQRSRGMKQRALSGHDLLKRLPSQEDPEVANCSRHWAAQALAPHAATDILGLERHWDSWVGAACSGSAPPVLFVRLTAMAAHAEDILRLLARPTPAPQNARADGQWKLHQDDASPTGTYSQASRFMSTSDWADCGGQECERTYDNLAAKQVEMGAFRLLTSTHPLCGRTHPSGVTSCCAHGHQNTTQPQSTTGGQQSAARQQPSHQGAEQTSTATPAELKPRLAVCLVGQPRTLASPCVAAALRTHVLDELERSLGRDQVSLFALLKGSPEEENAIADVRRVLQPTRWLWRIPPSSEQEPGCAMVNTHPSITKNPELSIAQFNGLESCWLAVSEYERDANVQFSAVLKLRPDAYWYAPIPSLNWMTTAYFSDALTGRRIDRPSDHAFAVPRGIAHMVLNLASEYRTQCRARNQTDVFSGHGVYDLEVMQWRRAATAAKEAHLKLQRVSLPMLLVAQLTTTNSPTSKGAIEAHNQPVEPHYREPPSHKQERWCRNYYQLQAPRACVESVSRMLLGACKVLHPPERASTMVGSTGSSSKAATAHEAANATRVALCIVGAPRSFRLPCVQQSIYDHVVEALWRQTQGNLAVILLLKRDASSVAEPVLSAELLSRWHVAHSRWLHADPELDALPGCKLTRARGEPMKASVSNGYMAAYLGQLRGFDACLDAVQNLEVQDKSQRRFDAVIKMRPDALWLADLPTLDIARVGYHADFNGITSARPSDMFISVPRSLAPSTLGLHREYRAECHRSNRSSIFGDNLDVESLLWARHRKGASVGLKVERKHLPFLPIAEPGYLASLGQATTSRRPETNRSGSFVQAKWCHNYQSGLSERDCLGIAKRAMDGDSDCVP